jgi:hypothetical protein
MALHRMERVPPNDHATLPRPLRCVAVGESLLAASVRRGAWIGALAKVGELLQQKGANRSPFAVKRHELKCGQHAGRSGSPGTPQLPLPSNNAGPGRSPGRIPPSRQSWWVMRTSAA